jgi:hypothetical protein
MIESRDAVAVNQLASGATSPLSFDERWARWEAKGARHDARVARRMRMILAVLAAIGVIWASVVLL